MHPALPVLANSKGDKTKSEDYYPKSRTGLGGLSLSSAGSSHLFRKDLSQSFAPLFVDPRTLTAEVKCAVRVPDEAFPTIANVPGAMISFKYFVEVVVDIQGKLTGLDRMLPNAGLVNVPSASGVGQGLGRAEDSAGSMVSTWGGNFVDTDTLRREKGVISCVFEVTVGTKDSERSGKRRQPTKEPEGDVQTGVDDITFGPHDDSYASNGASQSHHEYDQQGQYYDHYAYDDTYPGAYDESPAYHETHGPRPIYQPPATAEEPEELSEKERIRRAEARLLPSQPPDTAGPSAGATGIAPSAPVIPEDEVFDTPYSAPSQPPPFVATSSSLEHSHSHTHAESSAQRQTVEDDTRTATAGSSSTIDANPVPQPPSTVQRSLSNGVPPGFASSSSFVEPTDDKQEMQRRRLELERSAPNVRDDDDAPGPSAPPTSTMQNLVLAPSAPVLEEHDEELVGPVSDSGDGEERHRRAPSESLPVYER